jgi:predicted dehydrogenase
MSSPSLTRRDFVSLSALATAMLGLSGCIGPGTKPRRPRPIAPGAKIRVAQIGCAGKGFSDIMSQKDEEVVALCDIDWNLPRVKELGDAFPNAKRYTDFRKMLLEMDEQIDAVCVSTPDHMHFLPAFMAISMGKHVYVQKPLTQTVAEARELLRLARLHGVCTQMGNQGHAGEGIRLVKEWIDAGILGDVREAHIWTNRPVWPQGMPAWPDAETKPEGLEWDLFLGRAPVKPYSPKIHPFNWRGYIDYGCGALGDMACHLMDAAFWGLDLGAPVSVEAVQVNGLSAVAFPKSAIVRYQFPARGTKPPVTLTWYEGGLKPELTASMAGRTLAGGGQLLVGDKATVYDGNDYCNSPRIVPESLWQELRPKLPPKTIPRVPNGNPHKEWTAAIRAGKPEMSGSNFEYAAPFTEMVCLGTIAILVGKKFSWDPVAMKTDLPEANRLLEPVYRRGWKPSETL